MSVPESSLTGARAPRIGAPRSQRIVAPGAPPSLARPGRGATEGLAELPEGAARSAVQAIAKLGHQPLPGSIKALHGPGEGLGKHRRERPGRVDPSLGNPDPLVAGEWRRPAGKAVRARVPDWQQAHLRPAARVRQLVAAWLQQRREGCALPFGRDQDLLQPPVQVVDQLGDAGLLGHDGPNAVVNLRGVAGVGEVAVAARAGQDGGLGGSTDQRATVTAAQLQVQRPRRGGVQRALAQPTACHLKRQHPVAAVHPGVMICRGVRVVIQRHDELAGGAGGVLVAEPNHLRVALPMTAWQVVHGPQYRQPPQGFANDQLWLSPGSAHMGGVWLGLRSLEHILTMDALYRLS